MVLDCIDEIVPNMSPRLSSLCTRIKAFTMTSSVPPIIEFPIRQSEQARQSEAKNLLARDVYLKIGEHLKNSLARVPKHGCDLDDYRSHEGILIDGGRGTGKSSVLVNLPTYLNECADYLILKPVDPTLLEDGDDMMLNVIIAALLRDKTVKDALQRDDSKAEAFYEQLHKLGTSLEGMQTEKHKYGLDRLRSFMSDQALAEHVHVLFEKALELTGRRLAVLPIDDVDMSLAFAFKNIEVVRKYLTSPYVVPLLSGDLNMYNEIIWREFYSRLTENSKKLDTDAKTKTRELAEEYQRKVLPLPRRIELPLLSTYLHDDNIKLTDNGLALCSLPILNEWLDALLNERVNGESNSKQQPPLKTVREMSQFINTVRDLIPKLHSWPGLSSQTSSTPEQHLKIKRRLFMNADVAEAIEEFGVAYQKAFWISPNHERGSRTAREQAYNALRQSILKIPEAAEELDLDNRYEWYAAAAEYFRYQRQNGAAYFTAKANLFWRDDSKAENLNKSVLMHPLFQPITLQRAYFDSFDTVSVLKRNWSAALRNRVPESWLEQLPEHSILAYPVPEKGQDIKSKRSGEWACNPYVSSDGNIRGNAELIRRLLIHWSFYSSNARTNLILTGRLFELIVTSLVRDVSPETIVQILNSSPFYSVAALADTKTIESQGLTDLTELKDSSSTFPDETPAEENEKEFELAAVRLSEAINSWRKQLKIAPPHSWLIYSVMNKFYNQTHYNFDAIPNGSRGEQLKHVIGIGIQAYNTIWATFGSFEKGPLFGFPRVIAHVNMTAAEKNFEQSVLYRQNILPFLKLKDKNGYFDFRTQSYTYALESHPLRALVEGIFDGWNLQFSEEFSNNVLNGFTSPDEAARNSRRVGVIFNRCIRELKFRATEAGIDNLDLMKLRIILTAIVEQCKTPELRSALKEISNSSDLPPRSGRAKLQRCFKRYQQITDSDFLDERNL